MSWTNVGGWLSSSTDCTPGTNTISLPSVQPGDLLWASRLVADWGNNYQIADGSETSVDLEHPGADRYVPDYVAVFRPPAGHAIFPIGFGGSTFDEDGAEVIEAHFDAISGGLYSSAYLLIDHFQFSCNISDPDDGTPTFAFDGGYDGTIGLDHGISCGADVDNPLGWVNGWSAAAYQLNAGAGLGEMDWRGEWDPYTGSHDRDGGAFGATDNSLRWIFYEYSTTPPPTFLAGWGIVSTAS